jgi:hypothetical protein
MIRLRLHALLLVFQIPERESPVLGTRHNDIVRLEPFQPGDPAVVRVLDIPERFDLRHRPTNPIVINVRENLMALAIPSPNYHF